MRSKVRTSGSLFFQPRIYVLNFSFTGLLFCAILGGVVGLAYLVFDPVIKHVILSKLVLRNNSDFAELWSEPPITPHIKVYFFNLTNAEEFFAGNEKPKLKEVGPYVYQ